MKPLSSHFIDDLRHLRVLRTLREHRTVTATAAALHLTPSAISQQLAGLSREVGFPVTERHGRHVNITPRAQALLRHADAIFAEVERARQVLQGWDDGTRGISTIGAFSTAITGLLPTVMTALAEKTPQLQVSVTQAEPPGLFDRLDTGELDVALAIRFGGSPAADDPRYHQTPLGRDLLDVALPADHPLADEKHVDLLALQREPWITGSPDGCCAAITATACAAAGFAAPVVHRVDDWHALLTLVGQGHGVALVPRLAQQNLPSDVVMMRVAGRSPQRHLFAAVRNGAEDAPTVTPVLAALIRIAGSPG